MGNLAKVLILLLLVFTCSIINSEKAFAINKSEKEALIKQLNEYSLIVLKDNQITTSNERTLRPVLNYLDNSDLKNAYAFDRMIGRAAAWLYVYGNVKYVYADTISKPAIKILKQNNIKFEYKNLVDEVLNYSKTDMCPFEKLTKDIDNPTTAYGLIYHKIYPETSIVYFTPEITSDNLVKMYKTLNLDLKGNVAVKVHSGEPNGKNFLKPDFMKKLVKTVNGTIVECNTAYAGRRIKTEDHKKVLEEHGFTKIAKTDIMDEDGEIELTNPEGKQIKVNYVGSHLKNYDSMLVLSHFKGHQMGGFGGALKNISIGIASSHGKAYIHGAGDVEKLWTCEQNKFLESMADASKTIVDYFKGNMVFINVMANLSIDCDCNSNPATPEMSDIGILGSLNPVALDQACVDLVYNSNDKGKKSLIKRMESKNGIHILKTAEDLKVGTRKYKLIELK